jgi:hypothetical protein
MQSELFSTYRLPSTPQLKVANGKNPDEEIILPEFCASQPHVSHIIS